MDAKTCGACRTQNSSAAQNPLLSAMRAAFLAAAESSVASPRNQSLRDFRTFLALNPSSAEGAGGGASSTNNALEAI
jgi:hypothetical protein